MRIFEKGSVKQQFQFKRYITFGNTVKKTCSVPRYTIKDTWGDNSVTPVYTWSGVTLQSIPEVTLQSISGVI